MPCECCGTYPSSQQRFFGDVTADLCPRCNRRAVQELRATEAFKEWSAIEWSRRTLEASAQGGCDSATRELLAMHEVALQMTEAAHVAAYEWLERNRHVPDKDAKEGG